MAIGAIATSSKLVNTALLTFFIIGIETILDSSFECPTEKYSFILTGVYSFSFFICPAIVFIYVGLYYFPGFNKKQCCPCWSGNWALVYVILQIGKPPVIWLLISMTDGRYLSCFVMAITHYQQDYHLFVYIFQTTGMLTITLVVILWYYLSKCTCRSLDSSRRGYQMLADVEKIIADDKKERRKKVEKEKFLYALEHNEEYMDRKLPKYMLDEEEVLIEKLKSPTTTTGNPTEGH